MNLKISRQYARIIGTACAVWTAAVFLAMPVFAETETTSEPKHDLPRALKPLSNVISPTLRHGAQFDFSSISAKAVYVVDVPSHTVLLSQNAETLHPLASITKLMTAYVALDHAVPMMRKVIVSRDDEVGGARLNVKSGTTLTVRDMFNATLIGSANNMANALARSTRLTKDAFVAEMNAKAKTLGLMRTTFTEPTGIDAGNISNAKEIAALGLETFALSEVRRSTTSMRYTIPLANGMRTVKNTNALLVDEKNGLYVLGGKTGYLEESNWNLVVKVRDARRHPIEIVVLGSTTKNQLFKDATNIAHWVWDHYEWNSHPLSFRP